MTQFFFRGDQSKMPADKGFTLIELAIIVAIIAVAGAVSVPILIPWFNNMSVRSAARDLYSTIQEARLMAVEGNCEIAVIFDRGTHRYHLCTDPGADGIWNSASDMTGSGDNDIKQTVDFQSSRYKNRVRYGCGNATSPVAAGGTFDNYITYKNPDDCLVVDSKGLGGSGYVYLENPENKTVYAVGTRTSGLVRLVKWNGTSWN